MFGHFPELMIVLALALIVFGPEKLPEIAANAGKMVREFRELVDTAMNPEDHSVPDEDFSNYYYESLERSGEDVPAMDDDFALDSDEEGFWHVVSAEHDDTLSEEEVSAEHAELHEAMATLSQEHPYESGATPVDERPVKGSDSAEPGTDAL